MRNIAAVFWKQLVDTLKNKTILIQFLLFPVMNLILEKTVSIEGMPPRFFTNLFAVMYVGMAPLTCMSAILSEEKEKNTLRVLMMSNVSPMQYLIGIGGYVFLMCMTGALAFAVVGAYGGMLLARFLCVMAAGILLSELIGATIGAACRNQLTASSVTVPTMMILSFLPMLALFNESIRKIAQITYSQQISLLIGGIEGGEASIKSAAILTINFAIAFAAFVIVYRRKSFE